MLQHPNKLVRIIQDIHMCVREYFDSHAHRNHYLDNPEFESIFETLYFLGAHPYRLQTLCQNIINMYGSSYTEDDDGDFYSTTTYIEFPELEPYVKCSPDTLTKKDVLIVLQLLANRFNSAPDHVYSYVEDRCDFTFARGILPCVNPTQFRCFRASNIKRSTFCLLVNLMYKDVHRNVTEWVFDVLYRGDRENNNPPPNVSLPMVSDTIDDAEFNTQEGFLVVDQWQEPFWVWIKWIDTQLTHEEILRLFHASAGIIHHNGVLVKDYNEHAPYEIWPIVNKIRLTSLERVYSRKTREEFFTIPPLFINIPSMYIYDELEGIAKHFTPEFSDAVEALFEACPIANEEQANRYDLTINLMEDIKYVTTSVSANRLEQSPLLG